MFPSSTSAVQKELKPLSLRECIRIALENSSAVMQAEHAVRLQGSDVLKSYGQFLPKVSTSATYTPSSVSKAYADPSSATVAKTSIESVDLSLTTSLNLFNGFRDYAALQAAMKRKDAAGLSLDRARQTIVYDVTQSYFRVLLDRELLKIASENLSSSRDRLRLTKRQYEIGLKPVTDYYQQQAETATGELDVIRAENSLRGSRLELLRRLRLDPAEEIDAADIPKDSLLRLPRTVDRDRIVERGLAKRKDLQSAEQAARAAKWEVTRAAGQRYPTLDLSFILATGGNPYSSLDTPGTGEIVYDYPPLGEQLSDLAGYSLRLSMNWTIFDGFLTRHGIEQARINYLNESLNTGDLEHDIAIDINIAADNYTAAFKQIETSRQGLRAAGKAFETVSRKYDLGAASFVEANAARAALVAAKADYAQAVYNLALQKNVLDFTTGTTTIE
ncbi:transporter [Prosthecochloris sp. GSB1]|nr:transporter [Prosthecochloris sp. GSB1]